MTSRARNNWANTSWGLVLPLLTQEVDLSIVLDVIKGDADPGRFSVEDGKLAAVGLPGKCYDAFWKSQKGEVDQAEALHSVDFTSLYSHLSSQPRQRGPASLSCGRSQSW